MSLYYRNKTGNHHIECIPYIKPYIKQRRKDMRKSYHIRRLQEEIDLIANLLMARNRSKYCIHKIGKEENYHVL